MIWLRVAYHKPIFTRSSPLKWCLVVRGQIASLSLLHSKVIERPDTRFTHMSGTMAGMAVQTLSLKCSKGHSKGEVPCYFLGSIFLRAQFYANMMFHSVGLSKLTVALLKIIILGGWGEPAVPNLQVAGGFVKSSAEGLGGWLAIWGGHSIGNLKSNVPHTEPQ